MKIQSRKQPVVLNQELIDLAVGSMNGTAAAHHPLEFCVRDGHLVPADEAMIRSALKYLKDLNVTAANAFHKNAAGALQP